MDLTLLPLVPGLWAPWLPNALPQRWPWAWWLAVLIDQFSRKVIGFRVFRQPPDARMICALVKRAIARAGARPKYIVTDKGAQFMAVRFRRWCARRSILNRYASTESIRATAVIERFFRSLKTETRRTFLFAFRLCEVESRLGEYIAWYAEHRPHQGLHGKTPNEVYFGRPPANRKRRFEPRPRWPRGAHCARPYARPKKASPKALGLKIAWMHDQPHLPIVGLKSRDRRWTGIWRRGYDQELIARTGTSQGPDGPNAHGRGSAAFAFLGSIRG
jgi:hypothetical protein